MNEHETEKMKTNTQELRGQIGANVEAMAPPCQRESAKSHLRRVIDDLKRHGGESYQEADRLSALYCALPEQLSPDADAALAELLRLRPKRSMD